MSEPAPSEAVDGKSATGPHTEPRTEPQAESHTESHAGPEAGQVIEVDTVMSHPVDHVWRVLTTRDGVQALLGPGATLGGKGEPWHAADGSHGVWRSYHPLEQVRVSWHADADAPRSLVDLHLTPEGDATRVSLRHEAAGSDRDALTRRWSDALGRLESLAV